MQCRNLILLFAIAWLLPSTSGYATQWYSLFDGQTLQGWTTLDGQPVTQGWEAVDGMIHLNSAAARGGQIVTQQEYGDFELLFEWKIARGGNSGIKYRVKSFDGEMLGCEYQVIDDQHESYSDLRPNQLTGSLYELYAPDARRMLRPAGEFNRGRVVVQGNRIEHWLNGRLVVEATVGDRSWRERLAASKFAARDGFGANRIGKIMLTDHQTDVWYRNLFIRPLPAPEELVSQTCARPIGVQRRQAAGITATSDNGCGPPWYARCVLCVACGELWNRLLV